MRGDTLSPKDLSVDYLIGSVAGPHPYLSVDVCRRPH